MEAMEWFSCKAVRAGTMPARWNPKWNVMTNSSAGLQAAPIAVWIPCLG
jgi:hypothetical protein